MTITGHDALKSLGIYRVLSTYQLRFLHFPDMAPAELDALLASWRKSRLIGSKPMLRAGQAVHVLRPKGRMLLDLTESEVPRVIAQHFPKDPAALARMLLANDLTIAIRALRNTACVEAPWHPDSVDFMQTSDPTVSQMILTEFERQGMNIFWTVRFILDHGCEPLHHTRSRIWRITHHDASCFHPYRPDLTVLSRSAQRTRAFQEDLEHVREEGPGHYRRRAATLPHASPGIPRIEQYMAFVSEPYSFLDPHAIRRPIFLPLGIFTP